MGGTCTKSEIVMHLQHDGAFKAFRPSEGHYTEIVIPADLWDDMGKPKTITVAVQPGDLLNEE